MSTPARTTTPTEYQIGLQAIQRRRAIADAMQQQALSPISAPVSGTGSYPIQTKISPFQVLAQLGTAYVAKKQNEKADKQYSDIAKAMASDRAKALANLSVPQDMAPATSSDEGPTHAPMRQQQNPQAMQAAIDAGVDPSVIAAARPKDFTGTLSEGQKAFVNGQEVASGAPKAPKPEALDELAKLNANHTAGLINDKDYEARKILLTTRAPQLGQVTPGEDKDIDSIGKAVANYQIAPPSGGNRSPRGAAILAAALKYNQDYQAQEFGSRNAAYKAFATGKQGDSVKAFNVGISHLNTASDLADAMQNGDIQLVNRISQAFAEQTGNPAPTNLDTAKEVIKAEIVKAISGSSGGTGDRERALAGIDKASSPAQLHGAIETAKKLMGGQLGGLKRQFEHSTGRKDFESMLSEDAIPYLSSKEAGGNEAAGSGPPLKNSKGWTLHVDAKGNKAYVGPNNEIEEVR